MPGRPRFERFYDDYDKGTWFVALIGPDTPEGSIPVMVRDDLSDAQSVHLIAHLNATLDTFDTFASEAVIP